MELNAGAYEAVVTDAIAEALDKSGLTASLDKVDPAEAHARFGQLIADVVERAIQSMPRDSRVSGGAALANEIITLIGERIGVAKVDGSFIAIDPTPQSLHSLVSPTPTGSVPKLDHPLSPLSETLLLTDARKDLNLLKELKSELDSADSIDILGAFIRFTGVREFLPGIRRIVERGGKVRVMTTTYTGTTEGRALDELEAAGAEVRISYDRSSTRLHAKAWLFRRDSGFTTAYIGSSNLTHQAQVTGLEWNIRASVIANPQIVDRFDMTFESYWNDQSFVSYTKEQFDNEQKAAVSRKDDDDFSFGFLDLLPKPFQQGLLDAVEAERSLGHNRNLIVAATGTGKTVMAAIDYRNLRASLGRSRLLFVAHRKEILKQSQRTFRTALRDGSFGELWVDGERPEKWDHVFASIQSIAHGDLTAFEPDHWDVVVVDEFHHAEAATYRALLDRVQPKQLIGLTATPERADGLNVANQFNGRIAAELRLWDALEQGLLSPFHYFGIADGTDLSEMKWSGGYDVNELTNLYTADDFWVAKVLEAVRGHVGYPNQMRGLGFCASVAHAKFMASKFLQAGLSAVSVTGDTNRDEREQAVRDLRNGETQIIFTVDVFNEGVDIPEVDTVLFLRPTESSTVFLQQLGRGLRRTDAHSTSTKDVLTVLDFVGNQRKEFRFDQRFRKLLGGTRTEVEKQIEDDFPFLPAGCAINLDPVTKEAVLRNIREALPTGWVDRKKESSILGKIGLAEFLQSTGLELADIYAGNRSYTQLLRAVGHLGADQGAQEDVLGRALGRLLHIDDRQRLDFYRETLAQAGPIDPSKLDDRQRRLLTMLHYGIWGVKNAKPLAVGLAELWDEEIRSELVEAFDLLAQDLGPAGRPAFDASIPLNLHAHYARDEVLAAFDVGSPERPPSVREGVKWVAEAETDLLFVTINKSEKDYSPSTMYHDYAISRDLFHWESQASTAADSPTGVRYISHRSEGTKVALFVRNARKDDRRRTSPYQCLGLVDYVGHQGERPIAVTWRVQDPIPASSYLEYRAAVA